jgi:Protein of unknown function (DUF1189)
MNFLRTLLGSCAGLRFYRVAFEWSTRQALGYWAKLTLLLALIFVVVNVPRLQRTTDEAAKWIEREKLLPELTVEHGQIRSPVPQPYVRKTNDFIFILDTTGATALAPTGAVNGIILAKDRVYGWSNQRMMLDQPASALLPDGKVDAAYLGDLMRLFIRVFSVPMFALIFGMFFAGGLAQSALFCGIASVVERSLTPRYNFSQLFRFSILAITPAAVVATAYNAAGLSGEWFPLFYLGIYYFYLSGSTAACRPLLMQRPKPEPEHIEPEE